MHNILKHIKAFTLVELMVGIVLMSLVTVLMTPVVSKKLKSSQIMVNADQVRVPPGCNEFSPDCKMCYPHECIFCEDKGCGEIDTQYGKTSTVLVKELCKCRLCNSDKDAAFKAGAINYDVQNTVTSDKYCYKCTLNKKTCEECMPGYFLNASKKCEICKVGHYCPDRVNIEQCDKGYYQNQKGQTACIACDYGKYQNQKGKSDCDKCTEGMHQNQKGQTACIACDYGKYQNQKGQKECTDCNYGKYQNQKGQTACIDCDKGRYQNKKGQTACINCDEGYYQNQKGQTACIDCDYGRYQNKKGQTACIDCSPGTYAKNKKTENCSECTSGYYQNKYGQTACVLCDAGTYSTIPKATSCPNCGIGHACSGGSNRTGCKTRNGDYSDIDTAETCSKCTNGTYSVDANDNWNGDYNGVKCKDCPPGSYCSSGTKKLCQKGKFQNLAKQSACKDCDNGYCANVEGKTACDACSQHSNSLCTNCVKTTCVCTNCSSGYTLNSNYMCVDACPNECSACTPGTTSCTGCDSGYTLSSSGGKCCINIANCSTYNTNCTCAACKSGYFLDNGVCSKCSKNCSKCTSSTECTECNKDYTLYDKKCHGCEKDKGMYMKGVGCVKRLNEGNCTKTVTTGTCKATEEVTKGCCYNTTKGYFADYGAGRGACINNGGELPVKDDLKIILANATYRNYLSLEDGDNDAGQICKTGHDGNHCWAGRLFGNYSKDNPPYCKFTKKDGKITCIGSHRDYPRPIVCKFKSI